MVHSAFADAIAFVDSFDNEDLTSNSEELKDYRFPSLSFAWVESIQENLECSNIVLAIELFSRLKGLRAGLELASARSKGQDDNNLFAVYWLMCENLKDALITTRALNSCNENATVGKSNKLLRNALADVQLELNWLKQRQNIC